MHDSHKRGSKLVPFLLIGLGALCLAIHFGIYHETQASAFINQPEFYYTRFVIRDASGSTVKEVSMRVGCLSYMTAALSLALPFWGAKRLFWSKQM